MKNILIVGDHSYIGDKFIEFTKGKFNVSEINVMNDEWQKLNFSEFNAVIHVAAIVHHPEIKDESLYYRVNGVLPANIAEKSVKEGVKHYIFISTASVWGVGPIFNSQGKITKSTPLKPKDLYGKSKLQGEHNLMDLKKRYNFKLSIVRPPNVYGENCRGKFYHILEKLARFRFFPICGKNKFSMLRVDHLCQALQNIIEKEVEGVICPQDMPIISLSERIKLLSSSIGVKQKQFNLLKPVFYAINWICPNKYLNDLYGGFYYDPEDFPNP